MGRLAACALLTSTDDALANTSLSTRSHSAHVSRSVMGEREGENTEKGDRVCLHTMGRLAACALLTSNDGAVASTSFRTRSHSAHVSRSVMGEHMK